LCGNKKKKWNGKSLWFYINVYENDLWIIFSIKYWICWTLNLLENQSHKSKQVVFNIWGWYLKKWAFSKILFGRGIIFSPLDAAKLCWWYTVGFMIYSRVSLSNITHTHTHTHTYTNTLWHPYQHIHTIIAALLIQLAL